MRLVRLSLRRMPGIDGGFALDDLAPGLNLILGPNGSGKSSICRALQATLWPGRSGIEGADVESEWWLGEVDGVPSDTRLEARLSSLASATAWSSADGDTRPPLLPPRHLAPAYVLRLRDLLADQGEDDVRLADDIRVRLAGGYDLAALRAPLDPQRYGRKSELALAEAERVLHVLQGERRSLAAEQDRLIDLRAELALARSAGHRASVLRRFTELDALRGEEREVVGRIGGFRVGAESMARLSGAELEALDRLDSDLDVVVADAREAERSIAEADREERALALPGGAPEAAELTVWRGRAHSLELEAAERDRLAAEVSRLRAVLKAASAALAGDAQMSATEAPLTLGADELDRLEQVMSRALTQRERRLQLEARIAACAERELGDDDGEGGEGEQTRERLQRGAELLRDRMSLGEARSIWTPLGLAALALVALGGAAFAMLRQPQWLAPAALLVGALVAAFFGSVAGRLRMRRRRKGLVQAFEALDLGAFEPEGLRAQLGALEAWRAQVESALRAGVERVALIAQLDALGAAERALEPARGELAQWLGGAGAHGDLALADLLDRLRRWRAAEAAARAGAAQQESLAERARERLFELREWLGRHLGASASDAAHAVALLAELAERTRQLQVVAGQRNLAARQLDASRARIDKLATRRRELLIAAGVDSAADPRAELALRLGELPAFRAAEEALRVLRARALALAEPLAEHPEIVELDPREAERQLLEIEACAEEADALAQEIGAIEERIRAAGASGELEERRANVESARAAMLERRSELADALAGDWLVSAVEAEYEQASRPKVLQCAANAFASFTRNRLELVAPGAGTSGGLRARETGSGMERSLAELSDGTRTQLLLAARLAFATVEERGARPPLLLDEALTATDPERFRAVAQAVLALAAEGRQVFYLTCNPADVALFEEVADECGATPPRVIDLGLIRTGTGSPAPPTHWRRLERLTLPEPEGRTAGEYGALLGVPAPDPFEPIGELHLFHLMRDDLPLLHSLLSGAEVERVGHWRAFRATGGATALLDAEACERIDAAIRIAEVYFEAWRVGRGRPVDRAALEATGRVSDTFIERLSALASDVGGDAEALLAALEAGSDERTKRFRREARESLRDSLEGSGHLDDRSPLEPAALRGRVLARVSTITSAGPPVAPDTALRLIETLSRWMDARSSAATPGPGSRCAESSAVQESP